MTQTIDWGLLAHPIHNDATSDDPPWKDNAYLCFWDLASDVYGTLHTSTSPNAEGRRARLSLHTGGRTYEIVEELDPGTFSSSSIRFDGGATFSIDHAVMRGEVHSSPEGALGDFTGDNAPLAFTLEGRPPLVHYEQAARVWGTLQVDGTDVVFDGQGFRDRSWGFRDESASVNEYFGFMWRFEDFSITGNRALASDGHEETPMLYLDAEGSVPVKTVSLTRDASGLFAASTVTLTDGRSIDVRLVERRAGFWCPMGWERCGPTLSTFDEFCVVRTSDGAEGFGLIEQGIVRRLF